jgi:hypothetical protein
MFLGLHNRWLLMFTLSSYNDPTFLPNFEHINLISKYVKDFPWKSDSNFLNGKNVNYETFILSSIVYKLYFFLSSYLWYNQIWQHYFLDGHHFGYFTKSQQEPLPQMVPFSMHQMSPPLKVHMSILVDMLELNTSPLHMVHTLLILRNNL